MAKYIRIASDLHLEAFGRAYADELVHFSLPPDEKDPESILILAGDISSNTNQLISFLTECAKKFEHVIAVPGNHEAYGHELTAWKETLKNGVKHVSNVHYAEDFPKTKIIDGVRFVFGILWADGGASKLEHRYVEDALNDFYVIRNGNVRFSVNDMMKENKRQRRGFINALKEPFDGKTVAISHHLPSYRLISERFLPKPPMFHNINGGFASNCDDILASDTAPDLWVHGHTHDTIDTKLWDTRVICNPKGYAHERSSAFNTYSPVFVALQDL